MTAANYPTWQAREFGDDSGKAEGRARQFARGRSEVNTGQLLMTLCDAIRKASPTSGAASMEHNPRSSHCTARLVPRFCFYDGSRARTCFCRPVCDRTYLSGQPGWLASRQRRLHPCLVPSARQLSVRWVRQFLHPLHRPCRLDKHICGLLSSRHRQTGCRRLGCRPA